MNNNNDNGDAYNDVVATDESSRRRNSRFFSRMIGIGSGGVGTDDDNTDGRGSGVGRRNDDDDRTRNNNIRGGNNIDHARAIIIESAVEAVLDDDDDQGGDTIDDHDVVRHHNHQNNHDNPIDAFLTADGLLGLDIEGRDLNNNNSIVAGAGGDATVPRIRSQQQEQQRLPHDHHRRVWFGVEDHDDGRDLDAGRERARLGIPHNRPEDNAVAGDDDHPLRPFPAAQLAALEAEVVAATRAAVAAPHGRFRPLPVAQPVVEERGVSFNNDESGGNNGQRADARRAIPVRRALDDDDWMDPMMDFREDMDMFQDIEGREQADIRGMLAAAARDEADVVVRDDNNPRPPWRRRFGGGNGQPAFRDDNIDIGRVRMRWRLDALGARGRNNTDREQDISSYLFDLIREDRTCVSVLSGWSPSAQSCAAVVRHCNDHPEEAFFISPQGRPVIHEACLRGACRHVIQALVHANPRSVFEQDNQGNTALHLLFVDFSSALSGRHSSIYGRPKDMDQVVGDLLASRRPLNDAQNNDNDNHQNDVNHASALASSSNRQGDTPLHMACMAPEAIIDPNTIVQLLAANPVLAGRVNGKLQTPFSLHCRRRNASTDVARLLLDAMESMNGNDNNVRRRGANEVFRLALERLNIHDDLANYVAGPNSLPRALTQLDTDDGFAPIHHAAASNNVELLRLILERYPESALVRTSKQQSALHLVCRQQHLNNHFLAGSMTTPRVAGGDDLLAAVDLLLAADPDSALQEDTQSYTPLHLICKQGGFGTSRRGANDTNVVASSVLLVKRLLEIQPRAANLADGENYLPLHHACEVGAPVEIIRALLDANPSSARAETRKHDTALSLACTCNKSVDTVKLLIKANPHALKHKNDYGFVPLHCICRAYQPRMAIVEALVEANPSCVHLQTNAGETATHLAGSNSTAFVGILSLLTSAQKKVTQPPMLKRPPPAADADVNQGHLKSRIGNTPLHDACFRGSPFEHIETLAMANPEWITVHNNGGLSPLQILAKNGRLDERIITTFANIGGAEIFSVVDENQNTPLHSAMREETNVGALRSLVRALPHALHSKNLYGDSPLHLAIFRRASPQIVREVAMSSSSNLASPMLEPNHAGQTPIGIAIEEFNTVCQASSTTCCVSCDYNREQSRVFHVLATLVKILYYGPARCQNQDLKDLSLLHACISLHRKGVRLDPTFIRRAIHMYPGEVKQKDEMGNYPLTIEAGISVEKMCLLDGPRGGCCFGYCKRRDGILRILLEIYPDACKVCNNDGHFPLTLMIVNGREWGQTIAMALQAFPPALHSYNGLSGNIVPYLFKKASMECGTEVVFSLLSNRPDLLFEDPADSP